MLNAHPSRLPFVPLPHTGGPPSASPPPETPCRECRRLNVEGWQALLADDLGTLAAINKQEALHYARVHVRRVQGLS
ncbi:hypothetical protein [Streptomyces sp. UNOC14_S4]|uniref:hypothetical protein n=1 Tax=Streptomyces sp. UNOC14_S4 TaxID=2872340 RepID=UPI001E45FE22|nr:hypothetical protein [Streptomyces sp. UNOC14_S4]MCC3770028.1 hypothetical protein [Streptomyces sp. UNOC14_S4]